MKMRTRWYLQSIIRLEHVSGGGRTPVCCPCERAYQRCGNGLAKGALVTSWPGNMVCYEGNERQSQWRSLGIGGVARDLTECIGLATWSPVSRLFQPAGSEPCNILDHSVDSYFPLSLPVPAATLVT
jgi:hypothetical protein